MNQLLNNIVNFFESFFVKKESTQISFNERFTLGACPNIPDNRDISYPLTGLINNSFPASFGVESAVSTNRLLQAGESACVEYSFEFDKRCNDGIVHSRRFGYALTQQLYDLKSPGLPQREAAKVAVTVGMPKDSGYDNTTLSESEYRGLNITQDMRTNANIYRFGGFAFPGININAFKQTLFDKKIIHATIAIDWGKIDRDGTIHAPVTISGYHEVAIFWSENGKFSAANWWGYDLYIPESELTQIVIDAIVFTDIPEDMKIRSQKMPYIFQNDLKIGATSVAVAQLQKRLTQYGLFTHSITNYFGTITRDAVMAYQKLKGLPQTGFFGPLTRKSMNDDSGNETTVQESIVIKPSIVGIDEKFLHAIVMQESQGNIGAIGDKNISEHAYGPMQIRQPVCEDVNNKFGTLLIAQQMLNNLELSKDTFTKYMSIYFPYGGTQEAMARCWNAGPNWKNRMAATDGYWKGVQRYL